MEMTSPVVLDRYRSVRTEKRKTCMSVLDSLAGGGSHVRDFFHTL